MELFTNNAKSTLLSGITNVATSLQVAAGEGALFPALSDSIDYYWMTIENAAGAREIVQCLSRSGDVFTVVRGRQGTTAVAWSAGDKVELRLTAASLNFLTQVGRRMLFYYTDFEGNSADNTIFITSTSGGTITATTALETGTVFGVLRLDTGTLAANRASLITDGNAYRCNAGDVRLETLIRIPTLSNGTNRFAVRVGMIDSATGDANDGAYFEYLDSVSANWQICAADNSVRTKTVTSSAVVASSTTMTKLGIWVSGTTARYYINGVNVGTVSTNVPTTRSTGMGLHIVKSIGTTARQLDIDMWTHSIEFTNPR